MGGPAVGVYAPRIWNPALRDDLRDWLRSELWDPGNLETNTVPPWEFGILLPEDRPFAGHPEFATGITVETGGSYPSDVERAALAQVLGYAPGTELSISAWRNDLRDLHVLAWLAAEVAERLGGLIGLESLDLPKDVEQRATAGRQVIHVTWEEEVESPCPGIRDARNTGFGPELETARPLLPLEVAAATLSDTPRLCAQNIIRLLIATSVGGRWTHPADTSGGLTAGALRCPNRTAPKPLRNASEIDSKKRSLADLTSDPD